MEQLSLFTQPAFTVSSLTRYLRDLLGSDPVLQDVWVQGEITNLAKPSSGHVYFTLKDSASALRCVIWKTQAQRLRFDLQSGLAVEAHGAISLYERDGSYQLYVDVLRPAGEGFLYQEFLRLKARLEAEGLFAEERKRPLPEFPLRIGIVTSPTGAALQDMLNTLRGRFPLADVILAPCSVQGDSAPAEIAAALYKLNRLAQPPDVILLARGGGSLEDLWAFNDERVVRAVAASQAPVVTGVGHETDFTLADFAADLRAPTPTAAAVLTTPNVSDLHMGLTSDLARLGSALQSSLRRERMRWNEQIQRLERVSPLWQVRTARQTTDDLQRRGQRALRHQLGLNAAHLRSLSSRLETLSPLGVLQRGYALVLRPDGSLVRSIRQAQPDETVTIRVSDGQFGARVTGAEPQEDKE